MTVQYDGCGNFSLMFDDETLTLSEEKITKIQNFDFVKMQETVFVIEMLEKDIEDLEKNLEDLEVENSILNDEIENLEKNLEDLERKFEALE